MKSLFRLVLIFVSLSVPVAFGDDGDIASYRSEVRSWVRAHGKKVLPTIAPEGNDQASDLVDQLRFTRLSEMEDARLLEASLDSSPWSDTYWPTYAGQIANRYGDPNYNVSFLWTDNAEYLESTLGRGGELHLSPAEKYDLLIGDSSFTLTKKMIRTGAPYADREGSVPSWFGLCHGWAAASFMLPRPTKGVTAKGVDGRKITFTPSDIKALGTLLWANGAGETRFIGGRCNDTEPARDGRNRETNPDCFDTNPATWHIAVVNQIAVSKRSFVMDASAGFEVWNQPVLGYQYSYINPATGAKTRKLSSSKVKLSDWRDDPYAAKRSPKAEYVVKIVMSLQYLSENSPTISMTDSPENDSRAAQTYSYDLELDRDENIVGGEWYSTVHPDFLWVPTQGSKATSYGDAWLDWHADSARWDGVSAIPSSWQNASKMSSAKDQPLARVVSRLFEMASQ